MIEAFHETETWVAVALLIFVGLLIYLEVHRKLFGALDQRSARIKSELDEAVRLREEAKALLAEFERKARDAEGERLTAEAKTRMEDFVARRTKMAETKIGQAEAQALADVKAAAADAAVAAAGKILGAAATGKVAEDLLVRGIEDVRNKFN